MTAENLDPRIDALVIQQLLDGVTSPTRNRFMLSIDPGTPVSWHDEYGNFDEQQFEAGVIEVTRFVWHRLRAVLHAIGPLSQDFETRVLSPDEVVVLRPKNGLLTQEDAEAVVQAIPERLRGRIVVINGETFEATPTDLLAAIAERRSDEAFMTRLRERVAQDKPILDRLAEGETDAQPGA